MLLLAVDTSSDAVTAAVVRGEGEDAVVLAEHTDLDGRRHAELLAPAVRTALADAGVDRRELTGIVAGIGPGPFTGLRVGLVTARVLGFALAVPVAGVCSLDAVAAALAWSTPAPATPFLVATDARRREVYWARYRPDPDGAARLDGPHVAAPSAVPRDGLPVAGRGAALYPDVLGPALSTAPPSAGVLGRLAARALARGEDLPAPEPLYLRRPDAVEPGARKRVLG